MQQTLLFEDVNISIESYFVGVHGPCELHRKEKQMFMDRVSLSVFTGHMNCIGKKNKFSFTANAVHLICFSFR